MEIGVSWGHAFLTINAQRKIGVDPKNLLPVHRFTRDLDTWLLESKKAYRLIRQMLGLENIFFFEQTSDCFFRDNADVFEQKQIDVALIDGLHDYGQALRDTENCLKHLSPHGVIVLHDCNPANPAMAVPANSIEEAAAKKVPGWDDLWCGDAWKTILHLRSQRPDLNVFVLDCDMGIGIVTRGQTSRPLSMTLEQIQKADYQDLVKNRKSWLNLKAPSFFTEFLSTLKDTKLPT